MPASWVAASVRAQLLANRRLGRAGAAAVARSASLPEALGVLVRSPYGADLTPELSLEEAQRQVAAGLLWNLRLLAGWLPPGGSQILQPLAAWFEIANIDERLAHLGRGGHATPYQLGRLGSAWQRIVTATTPDAVREALATSRWGDPGTSDAATIGLVLRFRWAAWVAAAVPGADVWAATASILLAARALFASPAGRAPTPIATRPFGMPAGWRAAPSLAALRAMMPRQTAWVLDGVDEVTDLWRAEARWWSRLAADARRSLVHAREGSGVVVAAVALLAHDAWLTRAALASAARGERGRAVFDAVA